MKHRLPVPDSQYYFDHYVSFIESRLSSRDNVKVGYMEDHHITPKSLIEEGDLFRDSKENLIFLTPKEHYIAHKLLAKAYFTNHKIVASFWYMSNNGRYDLDGKDYEEARLSFSRLHSSQMSGENNPFYGLHHADSSIEKMKRHFPNRTGKNNSFYGKKHTEATKLKMSKSHSGITLTEEHKSKISESLIGNKRRVGHKYSEEEKESLRKRIFHKNCKNCNEIFTTKSNFVTLCPKCKEENKRGK